MADVRTPLLAGSMHSEATHREDNNQTRFRNAIGINVDNDGLHVYSDLETARRTASGLYRQVIDTQKYRNRQHRAFEVLFYMALASQTLIGAVLTALGPQSELHSTAITILGIFNTSIAGLLTTLKGQGLPDRFRKDEYQMKKVQDFIEETDSLLGLEGGDFTVRDIDQFVRQAWAKYDVAVDTAEMNKPDSYTTQKERPMLSTDKDGKKTPVVQPDSPSSSKDQLVLA